MPKRPTDDDLDFASEMAKFGVTPLESGRTVNKAHGRRSAGPARMPRRPTPDKRPTTPQSTPRSASQGRTTGQNKPREQEVASELDELRREVAAACRDRDAARQTLNTERETLEAERADSKARRQAWDTERTELHAERKALQHKLAEARLAADTRLPLRDLLEARGCADKREAIAVLRMLLDERPDDFLDAIVLASSQPLGDVLEDRVALVAEGLDLDGLDGIGPGSGCAVLRVPPERCEITGGSDIRAEFRRFADAARNASVRRVTIVGGSPAYRKQLQALAQPEQRELRLVLVPGNRRREKRRAESDVRSSDLVVIWGATELDHSVSDVYTHSHDAPLLRVPHRGISRMLGHVAETLRKRNKGSQTGKTGSCSKPPDSNATGNKNAFRDRKSRRKPKKR